MFRIIKLAFVAVLLATLSACGSSSSSSTASSPATPTSVTTAAAGSTSAQTVAVSLKDFSISPTTINVKAGAVTFNASNNGQSPHNFEIKATDKGATLGGTKNLDPGQNGSATITLQPGTYVGFCSEPGHESLGMKVSVVVS